MSPFFIVGVSRSGTSYLYTLLTSHPHIRLSYEGRLFTEGWQCYRRYKNLTSRSHFDRLLDDLMRCDQLEPLNQWIGSGISASKKTLFDQHAQHPSFTELIEQVYQLPGSARGWGNKMLRMEMVNDILTHWPEAKFVVLVRDPRAVYASQKRFFSHRRLKYSGMYWNLHAEAIQNCTLPEEQLLTLRYEDFVEDPTTHLERILKFTGLWNPETAAQMLETHPASPRSINKWRTDLSEKEVRTIESICFDNMLAYGYQPERVKKGIRLGMPTKILETLLDNKSRIPRNLSIWREKNILKRFWLTIRP